MTDTTFLERMKLLAREDPKDIPEDVLLEELAERYSPYEVPPCAICGGKLSLSAAGGGRPTVWACSPWEDDPAEQGKLRIKAGRTLADEHYSRSRHEQRRRDDRLVVELMRRYQALKSSS